MACAEACAYDRTPQNDKPGLTTGLLSGGINKSIRGSGVGDGRYLHKHDNCYRVQRCKGNGLYLAPHPRFVEGYGLVLKHGNDISDGDGKE